MRLSRLGIGRSVTIGLVGLVCLVSLVGRLGSGGPAPDPSACAPAEASTSTDPLVVVVDAGEAARRHDAVCGLPSDARRICRALWLAQQLDPVVVRLRSGDDQTIARAEAVRSWALGDARGISDPELAAALERLAAVDLEAADLIDRVDPSVLVPLRRAEAAC